MSVTASTWVMPATCRAGHDLSRHGRPRARIGHVPKWRCLVCDGAYLRTEIQLIHSADVDPVSVQRLIDGDLPEMATRHEAFLAVAHLTVRRGWGILRIAEHTGIAPRNISRYRRKIRLGQGYGSTQST